MPKKILLVEDEEGIANAFKKQLELIAGYEVVWCDGGKKALEATKIEKFDAILLDLVMPDFDGMAFLKEFNSPNNQYNKAPIIVLTKVTSNETKEEVKKYQIFKYVVKTNIIPTDLIEIIEDSIRK